MADTRKLADDLIALCLLDIDAALTYEQAIPHISNTVVKQRFAEFLDDHNRHIKDLSQQLRDLGETPPRRRPDGTGFFLKRFTEVHSASGMQGALEAMDLNERLVNRIYSRAAKWPELVPNARSLVLANYTDEKKHLQFMEESLEARVWERAGAVK